MAPLAQIITLVRLKVKLKQSLRIDRPQTEVWIIALLNYHMTLDLDSFDIHILICGLIAKVCIVTLFNKEASYPSGLPCSPLGHRP